MKNVDDKHKEISYLNKTNYVTREQWEAKNPKMKKITKTPIPYVVFTYSLTLPCETKRQCIDRVQKLQVCAMANCNLSDLKANFLIGGDGRIYEGRGWTNAPEPYEGVFHQLAPLNRKCIEVSFINTINSEPTKEQAEAAATLIREGVAKNILTKDVKVTTVYKECTIPKTIRNMENVRVSRHVSNSNGNPFDKFYVA